MVLKINGKSFLEQNQPLDNSNGDIKCCLEKGFKIVTFTV
jgi:hypothetical protein